MFEKMLRLWGDKSHLFTNQQLKHAGKWVITINSRILNALACLVLSHLMVFFSWTIFSADSYWKVCFARTVCLPGAIPEFTGGSLGNFTSSQLFEYCAPCLQQLHITTLTRFPGCEFIAIYRWICLVFTCTASCTCQLCACLLHVQ